VIPCLNEARSISRVVEEACEGLALAGEHGEVIVVDNASNDGSAAVAAKAGARVVTENRRGYGIAIQTGIRGSRADVVIIGDADGSYDFREVPRFVAAIEGGADVVVGCRFPRAGGRIDPGAMRFLNQRIGNPAFTLLAQIMFRVPTGDIHSGMRAMRCDLLDRLNLRTEGMEYASEVIIRAHRVGARIVDIPITLEAVPSRQAHAGQDVE